MACDICGETGTPLADLRDVYQTRDIKQICPECERIANKQCSKIQSVTSNIVIDLMKRFLRQRKNKFSITEIIDA